MLLESALAQPRQGFGGADLYWLRIAKAVLLGFSPISNHLHDGNNRVGDAALEALLALNGHGLGVSIGEQERIILAAAAGEMSRDEFVVWVDCYVVEETARDGPGTALGQAG